MSNPENNMSCGYCGSYARKLSESEALCSTCGPVPVTTATKTRYASPVNEGMEEGLKRLNRMRRNVSRLDENAKTTYHKGDNLMPESVFQDYRVDVEIFRKKNG